MVTRQRTWIKRPLALNGVLGDFIEYFYHLSTDTLFVTSLVKIFFLHGILFKSEYWSHCQPNIARKQFWPIINPDICCASIPWPSIIWSYFRVTFVAIWFPEFPCDTKSPKVKLTKWPEKKKKMLWTDYCFRFHRLQWRFNSDMTTWGTSVMAEHCIKSDTVHLYTLALAFKCVLFP